MKTEKHIGRKPQGRKILRLLIELTVAVMAAIAVFTLIYSLLQVPAEDLPLPPGLSHTVDDSGAAVITAHCGAGVTSQKASTLDPKELKQAMYGFVLRAEAFLLTVFTELICLSGILDSISVNDGSRDGSLTGGDTAHRVTLSGVALLGGGVLISLADALSDYFIYRIFFVLQFLSFSENPAYFIGIQPNFRPDFPTGAWIGGFLLILLGQALRKSSARAENPPADIR